MLAARPMARVLTSLGISRIVSMIARPALTEPPGELMYRLMSRPRVLGRQQQQLGADPVGDGVVDLLAEHHDALVEQPGDQLVVEAADRLGVFTGVDHEFPLARVGSGGLGWD